MNEFESNETVVNTAETVKSEVAGASKKSRKGMYIGIIIAIVIIVLGVLYFMEKEGRSSTALFGSMIDSAAVALVNGEKITNKELESSISQFAQMAAAQGVDTASSEAGSQIRSQALDVLINTQLLKQAAEDKGITVTDDEVSERLEVIKVDVGGEEILAERMAMLGIDNDRLHKDVGDELLIQKLLDTVFADKGVVVTAEEIEAVYADAGGIDAGLPAMEEVREQIEAQVRASKEQVIIDEYLLGLKEVAEIELKESTESDKE